MIAGFLDRLGISQVDLVGNDSGASISQVFAARYPSRLRSLTLTNCEVHDLWPNAMLKAAFDQFADPSIVIGDENDGQCARRGAPGVRSGL